MPSPIPGLRSPADLVGGLVYFGRMIDKIRLHRDGQLPADYVSNLGGGFDERCVHFLRVSYRNLVDRVRATNHSDEQLLAWALTTGRHPDEQDIEVWTEFMRKRGWKDSASELLDRRKQENGLADRADIETFFHFIDADEGRL